jgi:hypothetical protein
MLSSDGPSAVLANPQAVVRRCARVGGNLHSEDCATERTKAESMASKKKQISNKEIESKYDAGDLRITQERNDFLLPQIKEYVREERWVNIRPEYQRRLVWDRAKKSKFIESLLMNIPVPPIFLYEWDLNRYEVMDGQQRLNTIIEFYDNQLKLKNLEVWPELNGRSYADCPIRIQRGLDRRRISATVLLSESTKSAKAVNELRIQVFERLNTGGVQLNAQELRNAIYQSKFNDMIVELAGYAPFNKAWGIPLYQDNIADGQISEQLMENRYFQRMLDCEIVLRFFALRGKDKLKGSMRSILDSCMEENKDRAASELKAGGQRFKDCVDAAVAVFGDVAFKSVDDKKTTLSASVYDAQIIAVDRLLGHRKEMVKKSAAIRSSFKSLFKDEKAYDDLVGKPNTAKAVLSRIDRIERILKDEASIR